MSRAYNITITFKHREDEYETIITCVHADSILKAFNSVYYDLHYESYIRYNFKNITSVNISEAD